MPTPDIRLLLLLLIMLNHAVSACEGLVMHLPEENHPFTLLDADSHPPHQHDASAIGCNSDNVDTDHDDLHPNHAHVSCFVANLQLVTAAPTLHKPDLNPQYARITTSYAPPVPPPNL